MGRVLGGRTRAALEREKALTLRSIKELEFDRAMGKVSDVDFAEMAARLRSKAAGLIQRLDAGSTYREQIDRELARRGAAAPPPLACRRLRRMRDRQRRRRAVLQAVRPGPGPRVKPLFLLAAILTAAPALAQLQMPDPSLIHGRAFPGPELPTGTVTVRVVRESIGNDAPGQTVRVTIGGKTVTATTDAMGRAEFNSLAVGQEARATATVDGEMLESQPFTVPSSGGLRVILVAGIAAAAERRAQEAAKAAAAPAAKGAVVFGGNSRVLMQFDSDSLQVYYVLEIVNNARTRVDVGAPLVVSLPPGASGPTSLEGSSKVATLSGNR